MADRPSGPATAHLDHDTILVAALAADDLADLARADAEALIAACAECAALHADLVAIAVATRDLPTPARTRDFRLTAEQATRLRPSAIRRWLAAFGSPRLAVTRPLAVAFTTLGIAGLLLTAIPAGGPMGMLSTLDQRAASGAGGASVDIQGGGELTNPEPGVPAASDDGNAPGPKATEAPGDRDVRSPEAAPVPGQVPWLLGISVALLLLGIGLFALRRFGRSD